MPTQHRETVQTQYDMTSSALFHETKHWRHINLYRQNGRRNVPG